MHCDEQNAKAKKNNSRKKKEKNVSGVKGT